MENVRGAVMCGVRIGDTGTWEGVRSEHQRLACENGVGGSTDGMRLVIRTGCGVVVIQCTGALWGVPTACSGWASGVKNTVKEWGQ